MLPKTIQVFTDGGARGNPGPAASGVVILGVESGPVEIGEFLGERTNNEAEYLAFLSSLQWLEKHFSDHRVQGGGEVIWKLDSKLVVEQLNKRWSKFSCKTRMRMFSSFTTTRSIYSLQ